MFFYSPINVYILTFLTLIATGSQFLLLWLGTIKMQMESPLHIFFSFFHLISLEQKVYAQAACVRACAIVFT